MPVFSQIAAFAGRRSWRRFERATRHPEKVQQDLLQRILRSNRDTAYGRQHGFSRMTSLQDYQDGVPVGDYETFRPWVDRLKEGERRVLTSEDPYLFALTSGTGGQPKFIPVNRSVGHTAKSLSRLWLYRCLVRTTPRCSTTRCWQSSAPRWKATHPVAFPSGQPRATYTRMRSGCYGVVMPFPTRCSSSRTTRPSTTPSCGSPSNNGFHL